MFQFLADEVKVIGKTERIVFGPSEEHRFERKDGCSLTIIILTGSALIKAERRDRTLMLNSDCPATSLFAEEGDFFSIRNLSEKESLKFLLLDIKDKRTEEEKKSKRPD